MSVIDYSRWNHIEISDDEEDQHPNIDKESLWRWKKQARVERDAKEAAEKKAIHDKHVELQKKVEEAEKNPNALAEVDVDELKRQEDEFARKEAEIERKERLYPKWNSSNMCHDKWDKTVVAEPVPEVEQTDEDLANKQTEYMKAHKKDVQKFSTLTSPGDTEAMLLNKPFLLSEYAANFMVVWAVDLAVEEKTEEMNKVIGQIVTLQFLLQVRKTSSAPHANLVETFFIRAKKAEAAYIQAYTDEATSLTERVKNRAKERLAEAMAEVEAEEKQKRIDQSPGGVDPEEVMNELPQSMKDAFEARDIAMLQKVIADMDLKKAEYYIDRCTKSGLWVPGGDD
eukprot:CFRG5169T1